MSRKKATLALVAGFLFLLVLSETLITLNRRRALNQVYHDFKEGQRIADLVDRLGLGQSPEGDLDSEFSTSYSAGRGLYRQFFGDTDIVMEVYSKDGVIQGISYWDGLSDKNGGYY